MMLRTLLPFFFILPALCYSLISLICAWRYFAAKKPRCSDQPAVSILKPVKGMDEDSYQNFASFCAQEYSGDVQTIFAVASSEDPAIEIIRRLAGDFPDRDISLVVNPTIHGPNYKVSNLINAFPMVKHDIIVICDSDIRVSSGYLASVAAHFSNPEVGLVASLYRTSKVHGVATAIEATGFSAEMIPNVMTAMRLEGLSFALGASMAVRREALADIGGFQTLSDYLADDYQLGNKIHRAGWKIALDDCFVESMISRENLATTFSRQLRWARTMRVSRPGGYLALGITLPFPALLFAALSAPSLTVALAAVFLLYVTRLSVAIVFSRHFVRDNLLPSWLWLIPLRDMLAFFSWLLSFLGNRVEWRGARFVLKTGGKLEEVRK